MAQSLTAVGPLQTHVFVLRLTLQQQRQPVVHLCVNIFALRCLHLLRKLQQDVEIVVVVHAAVAMWLPRCRVLLPGELNA